MCRRIPCDERERIEPATNKRALIWRQQRKSIRLIPNRSFRRDVKTVARFAVVREPFIGSLVYVVYVSKIWRTRD